MFGLDKVVKKLKESRATQCEFKTGDIVKSDNGSYRVVRQLGKGGFGTVYEVQDTNDDARYALKLFRLWEFHGQQRSNYISRFERAYNTMNTSSPYLVHSLDLGVVSGNPFHVMEFCKCDLHSLMKDKREGKEDLVVNSMYSVMMGIRELHSRQMVHRDLKPANVLVRNDGSVALSDFDLAGDANERLSLKGQVFYSPVFAPPEQLHPSKKRDPSLVMPSVDIFSFAVMTYNMLTGRYPYGEVRNDKKYYEKDVVVYYANVRKNNWNRQRLNGLKYADFWKKILEPCLKYDYNDRLSDIVELIKLFEDQFPWLKKDNAEDSSGKVDYSGIVAYGLLVMYGAQAGRCIRLDHERKRKLNVGRNQGDVVNDIDLQDDSPHYISRRHATLEWDRNSLRWYVRDGQYVAATREWVPSRNGTLVNSKDADVKTGMPLNVDDALFIGDFRIKVVGYDTQSRMYYDNKIVNE